VCQAVEHHVGSRVESYAPLFALLDRLLQPTVLAPEGGGGEAAGPSAGGAVAGGRSGEVPDAKTSGPEAVGGGDEAAAPRRAGPAAPADCLSVWTEHVRPSLTWQALRLLKAVVHGHCKVREGKTQQCQTFAKEQLARIWGFGPTGRLVRRVRGTLMLRVKTTQERTQEKEWCCAHGFSVLTEVCEDSVKIWEHWLAARYRFRNGGGFGNTVSGYNGGKSGRRALR
jgi:hypothetical protein